MLNTIELSVLGFSEVPDARNIGVVVLIDQGGERILTYITDILTQKQIQCRKLLPERFLKHGIEVLTDVIGQLADWNDFKVETSDLHDGEYICHLVASQPSIYQPIRMSDALLLHLIKGVKLLIDSHLFAVISQPYTGDEHQAYLPIDVLNNEQLEVQLERAVKEENYRLAANIKKLLIQRIRKE